MSRNASGTYSLPAGNPVIADTLIESNNWANPTMEDLGAEITDSLSRDGKGDMRAALGVVDGSEASPGVSFVGETGSGMFREVAGDWGFSVLGTQILQFLASAINLFQPVNITGKLTVTGDAEITGDVGIGIDPPDTKLHVVDSTRDMLTLECTDGGAFVGPNLLLFRNSVSPAATDILGSLDFEGQEETSDDRLTYARIQAQIVDPTDTEVDGLLQFFVAVNGGTGSRMELGAGLYTTGATGGDKGVDTINAAEIYKGGNPITIQDIAWVIPGEPKVSSITKMKVARDLNWVFDTPALGYVDTLPSSAFIVTIRSYLTGGANDTIIGTLTFGTGSKIGVWSATAGSDVAVVSEKMLGIEIPANVFSAEDLSITLPMSIS